MKGSLFPIFRFPDGSGAAARHKRRQRTKGNMPLPAPLRRAPKRNAYTCARMHIYGYGGAAAFASRAADAARRFAAAKKQSLA